MNRPLQWCYAHVKGGYAVLSRNLEAGAGERPSEYPSALPIFRLSERPSDRPSALPTVRVPFPAPSLASISF